MLPSIKSFAIAFAVSIIIFGTLGFVITPLLKDATSGFDATLEKESTEETEMQAPSEDPNEDGEKAPALNIDANSFTMLIIGTDYQPNIFNDYRVFLPSNAKAEDYVKNSRHYTADTILIIHADKETGDFLITSLPKTTKVTSHGVVTTLGEAYETVTIDYFKQLITSIISLSIDYCIEMQVNMARDVIDFMYPTGIPYEVPYNMYYVNEEERVLMPGTSLDDYEYEYDENGNKVLREIHEGGELMGYELYDIGSNGQAFVSYSEKHYIFGGYDIYEYYDLNKPKSHERYSLESNTTTLDEYQYDDGLNMIGMTKRGYSGEGTESRQLTFYEYKIGSNGQLYLYMNEVIHPAMVEYEIPEQRTVSYYREDGRELSTTIYDADGNIISHQEFN